MKKNKLLLPLNLQYFADGNGDGADNGNDSGAGADNGNSGNDGASGASAGNSNTGSDNQSGGSEQTFDDFLKNGYQSEFDTRVQKAINTAVNNAQQKWQLMTDDQVSEAEKLAKMNQQEKNQYMQQKKEKELVDKEVAITRRELMAESKNTLAEKKIPIELAEILNYADADTCKKSIESVESAFQKAVEAAVEEKLKGGVPPKKPNDVAALEIQVLDAMSQV